MPSTTDPAINAGVLDKRITLLRPIYSSEYQDEIGGWEPVTDVWAGITPNFGQEVNEASRTVATALVPIVIRYRTDIDARWRIVDRERTYEIKAILDIARRHVQLLLNCEEVK